MVGETGVEGCGRARAVSVAYALRVPLHQAFRRAAVLGLRPRPAQRSLCRVQLHPRLGRALGLRFTGSAVQSFPTASPARRRWTPRCSC